MSELNEEALTAAHLAVENELIEWRDARRSVMGPANGFVVKERDGSDSSIMRFGTRDGLRIGIKAYLETLPSEFEAGIAAERERATRIARMHADRARSRGNYGAEQDIRALADDILVPKRAHGDVRRPDDNALNDTKEEEHGEDDPGPR